MTNTFSTILCWQDEAGDCRDARVTVKYTYYSGMPYSSHAIDPPEEPSVEIQSITTTSGDVLDGRDWFDDADLKAECMEDWADDQEAGAEYRAEQRANSLWED